MTAATDGGAGRTETMAMTDGAPREADNAGVILPPPVIYLGFIALGGALHWLAPAGIGLGFDPGWPGRGLGILLIGLAAGLGFLALCEFRRAGTNVDPHKPSTAIITGGPFRWSRNPLYTGLAAIHAGVGLLAGSGWILIALIPALVVIRYGVIAREERYLEAKFGDEYRAYMASVRRWI